MNLWKNASMKRCVHKDFIAVLFVEVNNWKQSNCISIGE